MRILFISNDFPPRVGGINYYVHHLARLLPQDEVVVFTSTEPGWEEFDASLPHRVVRMPVPNLFPTPKVERAVHDLIQDWCPDVVVFGASVPLGLLGPRIRRRFGIPYVLFTHGVEAVGTLVPLARSVLGWDGRQAALITTVSHWTQSVIQPFCGTAPFVLLPPGIDHETFRPDVDPSPVIERHALEGTRIICCVSRLVDRKGQDRLIDAMPVVLRRHPQAHLLIVGSGPARQRLERRAGRRGVRGSVTFAGEVSYQDLPLYFRAGEVFAMPCRHRFGGLEVEAYGAVFTQASAVGRPAVGGHVGGVPDAIRDGETGHLVAPDDVGALATVLIDLLTDTERARGMGESGAKWVHGELTWQDMADALRRSLTQVVGAA